ncbi:hypothetical protein ACLOJK_004743 [Asimina triloba]
MHPPVVAASSPTTSSFASISGASSSSSDEPSSDDDILHHRHMHSTPEATIRLAWQTPGSPSPETTVIHLHPHTPVAASNHVIFNRGAVHDITVHGSTSFPSCNNHWAVEGRGHFNFEENPPLAQGRMKVEGKRVIQPERNRGKQIHTGRR